MQQQRRKPAFIVDVLSPQTWATMRHNPSRFTLAALPAAAKNSFTVQEQDKQAIATRCEDTTTITTSAVTTYRAVNQV